MSGLVAHHFFMNSCGTFHEQRSLKVNEIKTQQRLLSSDQKKPSELVTDTVDGSNIQLYNQLRLVCYPHDLHQGGFIIHHPRWETSPVSRLTKWRINRINRCDIEKTPPGKMFWHFVKVAGGKRNKKNMDFRFKEVFFFFEIQVVFGEFLVVCIPNSHETPKI